MTESEYYKNASVTMVLFFVAGGIVIKLSLAAFLVAAFFLILGAANLVARYYQEKHAEKPKRTVLDIDV